MYTPTTSYKDSQFTAEVVQFVFLTSWRRKSE